MIRHALWRAIASQTVLERQAQLIVSLRVAQYAARMGSLPRALTVELLFARVRIGGLFRTNGGVLSMPTKDFGIIWQGKEFGADGV